GAAGVAWPLEAGIVLASEVEWLGAAAEVTGAAQAGIQAADAAQEQDEEEVAAAPQAAAVGTAENASPVAATAPVADGGVPHDEPASDEGPQEDEPATDEGPQEDEPATDEGPQQDEPATDSGVAQTEVSPAVEQCEENEIAAVADDGLQ